MKIVGWIFVCAVVAAGGYFSANYVRHDAEKLTLTEDVRRRAGGDFVRLADGVTHFELAGAENPRTVVLVHGFSVPYYLWDQNFEPLAKAGFRVVRYDLYGRGFSDRPDVRYDAELFDRQLTALLDALKIPGPVDIVGASLGGPIVITFADRHPERVRTISLLDPGYLTGLTLPWKLRAPVVGEYVMCTQIAPGLPEGQKEDFLHPEERYPDYFAKYGEQMQYKGFRRAILGDAAGLSSAGQPRGVRSTGAKRETGAAGVGEARPASAVRGEQGRAGSVAGGGIPCDRRRSACAVLRESRDGESNAGGVSEEALRGGDGA